MIPFVDSRKLQDLCNAAHMQMTACERMNMPIKIEHVLRDQNEVDTHVTVGIERLDIIRNFAPVWA